MNVKTPLRHKRFNQKQRLFAAGYYLQVYTGDKVARAYRKYFGVGWGTAFREIETLGIQFPMDYKDAILNFMASPVAAKKQKQVEKLTLENPARNENFAFIAGYTCGGAAYGIPWGEWEQSEPDMPR